MTSTQARHAMGAPLQGADEGAVTSPEDPPDHSGRLLRESPVSVVISKHAAGYPHTSYGGGNNHGFSKSWTGATPSFLADPNHHPSRRPSLELSTGGSTPVPVPASPSVADSQSDFEHELDSPSSLSSWNSYVGGRRGDLADVEDLELDGGVAGCEPELETVSELDEESSSFASGSDRPFPDSEDDDHLHQQHANQHHHHHHNNHHTAQPHQARIHHSSPRRKMQGMAAPSPPPPPTYPHFSPRAGGHGLSHASRYTLRAPPNLAARRRKGRIAELADEGAANDSMSLTPTAMPPAAGVTSVNKGEKAKVKRAPLPGQTSKSAQMVRPAKGDQGQGPEVQPATRESKRSDIEEQHAETAGPRNIHSSPEAEAQDTSKEEPGTPTPLSCTSSLSWNEFEFNGPPAIPPRCISPSETVPAVPSPLSVCLNSADEGSEQVATVPQTLSITADDKTAGSSDNDGGTPTPTARKSSHSATDVPNSPASPLNRKSSRGRRSSSPTRSKTKMPLRPCFRRRSTAQNGESASSSGGSPKRESSSERDISGRGRANKVRFSVAPPQEVRTHSPVEYDRKACPINNRLSPEDVEELRSMKMEMGLLEAKWAAMSACKDSSDHGTDGEESDSSCPSTTWDPRKWKKVGSTSAPSTPHRHNSADESSSSSSFPSTLSDSMLSSPSTLDPYRKRADSIASESPSSMCGSRFAERDSALLGVGGRQPQRGVISPAEHLRMEREKERERACRLAGIGTGVGFRYSGGQSSARQMHHGGMAPLGCQSSLISRFGLSKPPPPLPGTPPASVRGSPSCSGSSSPHDFRSIEEQSQQSDPQSMARARSRSQSPGTSQSPARSVSAPPVRGRPGLQTQDRDGDGEASKEEKEGKEKDEEEEYPRGRSLELRREPRMLNDSASTDTTITPEGEEASCSSPRSVSTSVPSLTHTSPSPERSSSASSSPTRRNGVAAFLSSSARSSPSPPKPHAPTPTHAPYPTRPGLPSSSVSPLLYKQVPPTPAPLPTSSSSSSTSSTSSFPSSIYGGGGGMGSCGYDSPASEFYESGSEYDLIG